MTSRRAAKPNAVAVDCIKLARHYLNKTVADVAAVFNMARLTPSISFHRCSVRLMDVPRRLVLPTWLAPLIVQLPSDATIARRMRSSIASCRNQQSRRRLGDRRPYTVTHVRSSVGRSRQPFAGVMRRLDTGPAIG